MWHLKANTFLKGISIGPMRSFKWHCFRLVAYWPRLFEMAGSKKGQAQGNWDLSAMKNAVYSVNIRKMSVKSAAKQHGIP